MQGDEFWIHNPRALVHDQTLIPSRYMTDEEILNTMTRLILVVALVLFILGIVSWWIFLIVGIAMIFILHYAMLGRKPQHIEYFRCPSSSDPVDTRKLCKSIVLEDDTPTQSRESNVERPIKVVGSRSRMWNY